MAATQFLVLEIPALRTPFLEFSRQNPSASMDLVIAPPKPGVPMMRIHFLLRGAPPGTVQGLRDDLLRTHGSLKTVRMDEAAGSWMGSLEVPAKSLEDPKASRIAEFFAANGLGAQWVRIEQGTSFCRAQVREGVDAQALANRLRGFLEALGVDADVAVEAGSDEDLGPWHDLVDQFAHPR